MLNPQIKSLVKLFTNEGSNENVFRQNSSEGQKISGSLFNVTESKLFGENKVKSNNSIFQAKEVQVQTMDLREKPKSDDDKIANLSENFEKMQTPGRHVLSNGTIITNDEYGRTTKMEFNAGDKDNRYTVEKEYKNGGSSKYVETYKDNNNKVRYSEEHSEEDYKDKDGKFVTTKKTTVRDAKGNIVYIKTVKEVTSYEKVGRNTYQPHRTVEAKFQDSNGKEISIDQAFEKRNKLRTPAMKEHNADKLEKLRMGDI